MDNYKDLDGINYVCYFKKEHEYMSVINMLDTSTVENTGELWCKAAYGNALIFLKNAKITDALYLMEENSMNGFNPITMSREEQIKYLEEHAKKIITR